MCIHRQAVEVQVAGEVVACLCTRPDCYQQLPALYVWNQYDNAWRQAHCQHTAGWIDLIDLRSEDIEQMCIDCGLLAIRNEGGQ